MAKSSMIAREAKRTKTVAKYAKKREELKAKIKDVDVSYEDRMEAQQQLQKLRVMRVQVAVVVVVL